MASAAVTTAIADLTAAYALALAEQSGSSGTTRTISTGCVFSLRRALDKTKDLT